MAPWPPTPLIRLHPHMQLDPSVPVRPPSIVLRDDYMHPRALSIAHVARHTRIPTRQLGRILHGAPINTEEALRLAAMFDTSELYWLLLQAHDNVAHLRRQPLPGRLGVGLGKTRGSVHFQK